jgi:hypothetical protein
MSMRFAIVVIASLLITNSLLAGQPGQPGPSKDIPELAPLGNWAGVWSGRMALIIAPANAVAASSASAKFWGR